MNNITKNFKRKKAFGLRMQTGGQPAPMTDLFTNRTKLLDSPETAAAPAASPTPQPAAAAPGFQAPAPLMDRVANTLRSPVSTGVTDMLMNVTGEAKKQNVALRGFADGGEGEVDGPGDGNDDAVGPVMLSNDEYVLPAKSYGALKKMMGGKDAVDQFVMQTNDGKPPRGLRAGMATGGMAEEAPAQAPRNGPSPFALQTLGETMALAQQPLTLHRPGVQGMAAGGALVPYDPIIGQQPGAVRGPRPVIQNVRNLNVDPVQGSKEMRAFMENNPRAAGGGAPLPQAAATNTTPLKKPGLALPLTAAVSAVDSGFAEPFYNPGKVSNYAESVGLGAGRGDTLIGQHLKEAGAQGLRAVENFGNAVTLGGAGALGNAISRKASGGNFFGDLMEPSKFPETGGRPATAAPVRAQPGGISPEEARRGDVSVAAMNEPQGLRTSSTVGPDGIRRVSITDGSDGMPAPSLGVPMIRRSEQNAMQERARQESYAAMDSGSLESQRLREEAAKPWQPYGDPSRAGRWAGVFNARANAKRTMANDGLRQRMAEANLNANVLARGQDMRSASDAERNTIEAAKAEADIGNMGLRRAEVRAAAQAAAAKEANAQGKDAVEQFRSALDRISESTVPEMKDGKPTGNMQVFKDATKRNMAEDFFRRKGGWEKLDPPTREAATQEFNDAWAINNALQAGGTKNNWFGDLFGDKQTTPGNTQVDVVRVGPANWAKRLGTKSSSVWDGSDPYIHMKHGAIIPVAEIAANGEADQAFRRMLARAGNKAALQQYEHVVSGIKGVSGLR